MSDGAGEGRGGGAGYVVESSTCLGGSGWRCEGCEWRWGGCGGGDSGRVLTGGWIEDNGVAR